MSKSGIYLVQFGTGSNINLLPLAAGQLAAKIKSVPAIMENSFIGKLIVRRDEPAVIAENLENPSIIGFSGFLWTMNHSLLTAKAIKQRFPEALIVFGGPAVPTDADVVVKFLETHNYIDLICKGEGEAVFTEICENHLAGKPTNAILGTIHKNRSNGAVTINPPSEELDLSLLPSPYLDGTFEEVYLENKSLFSGVILESNRGCPFKCTFCTWGAASYRKIREKPLVVIEQELQWIADHNIGYIAMSDANFGIRKRDVDIANMFNRFKKNYGIPKFISVSWVKNASNKIHEIADILNDAKIGFRVTKAKQSLDEKVLGAIKRSNIKNSVYEQVVAEYRKKRIYSYTEIIVGLPKETYDSFITGIEASLGDTIFEQINLYPLFLFPNTDLATTFERREYGLISNIVDLSYTKSKESRTYPEFVEMVVGSDAMPADKWIQAFVIGYYTLAIYDDRLLFFVMQYLKRTFNLTITDIITFMYFSADHNKYPFVFNSFDLIKNTALGTQIRGKDHLIRPSLFDGIPFDPDDGVFLELICHKPEIFLEYRELIFCYLQTKGIKYDEYTLNDLFSFQEAIVASPFQNETEDLHLNYNWPDYFNYVYSFDEMPLKPLNKTVRIIDSAPSQNSPSKYISNHFNVRGIPAFNELYTFDGNKIFPPISVSIS